jgi:hypothetical protein
MVENPKLPPVDDVDPDYVETLEQVGAPEALVQWMKEQAEDAGQSPPSGRGSQRTERVAERKRHRHWPALRRA